MEPLRDALLAPGGEPARGLPLPPLPRGYALIRVVEAAWTGFEEAVRQGLLPAEPGTVMGASAAGRLVTHNCEQPPPGPGLLSVSRVGEDWLPGLRGDGLLATHAAAPCWALEEAPRSWPGLTLHASLACGVLEALEEAGAGSALVAGAGVFGLLAAAALADAGVSVEVFTAAPGRAEAFCRGECRVARTRPRRAFDALVVATASAGAAQALLGALEPGGTVAVTPWSAAPCPAGAATVTVRGGRRGCWVRLLERLGERLAALVRVVEGGLSAPPMLGGGVAAYLYRLR